MILEENKPSHWFMNGSTLRITKAGYEDRATIHCNISNVHATLLYAAYLNVVGTCTGGGGGTGGGQCHAVMHF